MSLTSTILSLLQAPLAPTQLIEELIEHDYYPTDESLKVQLCQLKKKGLISATPSTCPLLW